MNKDTDLHEHHVVPAKYLRIGVLVLFVALYALSRLSPPVREYLGSITNFLIR